VPNPRSADHRTRIAGKGDGQEGRPWSGPLRKDREPADGLRRQPCQTADRIPPGHRRLHRHRRHRRTMTTNPPRCLLRSDQLSNSAGSGRARRCAPRDSNPSLLIRRQCHAHQRPGYLVAGLPRRFSLARIVFHHCSALYGQNQATSAVQTTALATGLPWGSRTESWPRIFLIAGHQFALLTRERPVSRPACRFPANRWCPRRSRGSRGSTGAGSPARFR
jgi:hypothetical protein